MARVNRGGCAWRTGAFASTVRVFPSFLRFAFVRVPAGLFSPPPTRSLSPSSTLRSSHFPFHVPFLCFGERYFVPLHRVSLCPNRGVKLCIGIWLRRAFDQVADVKVSVADVVVGGKLVPVKNT